MKSRRLLWVVSAILLLGAGAAAAVFVSQRRDVTTSSRAAYDVYKDAVANENRFYTKEARLGYAKALELDPQFAMAMLGLARLSKDEAQEKALVRRAAKEKGRLSERERLHVEMWLAFSEKRRDDAIATARELHAKYPDDVRSAMVLAGNELWKGDRDSAIRIFEELLSVDPNNAEAYNQIGYHYGYRGEYEKAMENLRKYQFIAADNANPFDSLGEVQAYSGRYNEAIENLERALAIKPDFTESYAHLAVAYEGLGEYAKAQEFYSKAAELTDSPDMQRAYYGRAVRAGFYAHDKASIARIVAVATALPKSKHSDIENESFEAALDLAEGRAAQAERRIRALEVKLAELVRAEAPPAQYKAHFPGFNALLAIALEDQGKTDEALVYWQKNANPPNPYKDFEDRRAIYEARAAAAEILARKGQLDEAEKLIAENRKWNASWAPTRSAEVAVAELRRAKVLAASK